MSSARDNLLRAVTSAATGDWRAAHEIAQEHEGDRRADWLHGVVHRLEGDLSNAAYWYRQAGRTLDPGSTIEVELERIRAAIEGE